MACTLCGGAGTIGAGGCYACPRCPQDPDTAKKKVAAKKHLPNPNAVVTQKHSSAPKGQAKKVPTSDSHKHSLLSPLSPTAHRTPGPHDAPSQVKRQSIPHGQPASAISAPVAGRIVTESPPRQRAPRHSRQEEHKSKKTKSKRPRRSRGQKLTLGQFHQEVKRAQALDHTLAEQRAPPLSSRPPAQKESKQRSRDEETEKKVDMGLQSQSSRQKSKLAASQNTRAQDRNPEQQVWPDEFEADTQPPPAVPFHPPPMVLIDQHGHCCEVLLVLPADSNYTRVTLLEKFANLFKPVVYNSIKEIRYVQQGQARILLKSGEAAARWLVQGSFGGGIFTIQQMPNVQYDPKPPQEKARKDEMKRKLEEEKQKSARSGSNVPTKPPPRGPPPEFSDADRSQSPGSPPLGEPSSQDARLHAPMARRGRQGEPSVNGEDSVVCSSVTGSVHGSVHGRTPQNRRGNSNERLTPWQWNQRHLPSRAGMGLVIGDWVHFHRVADRLLQGYTLSMRMPESVFREIRDDHHVHVYPAGLPGHAGNPSSQRGSRNSQRPPPPNGPPPDAW